ncbi:MAG TPA: hypothetical protein VMH40_04565 [Myxococcaceae bacterium]|nr:hypothetical protein [Myxococcaceae bacterium]
MLSLSDLALLSALPPRPLSRPELTSRALAVAKGPVFDRAVALATIDRLTALGLIRRVGARYELSREGQCAMMLGLEEYRAAIERMRQTALLRLVEEPAASAHALALA